MPNPPLNLPPTAAELDARLDRERLTDQELHGGPCPTCGQMVAPLTNRFATGSRGVVPVAAHGPDSPLDPDGELGYAVYVRLRNREPVADICAALDVSKDQVQRIARHQLDRGDAA